MVDLGAGAGIPGVPLRIVRPEIALTLIESKRKRVSFLASLRRELGLEDVRILEGRAEDLVMESAELAGRFDVVVCRSVSPVPDLVPIAMKYLTPGGSFVASGPPPEGMPLRAPNSLGIQAQTVSFPDLGLSRTFLSAIKGAPLNGAVS
jgi:16S rRNA (guanine527-N7)-methyltransferase